MGPMTLKHFLLFPLLILAASCSSQPAKNQKPTTPVVAVSIPPYISLVKAIGGDKVKVVAAISQNQNPHLSETTFKQVSLIDNAALWIGVGEAYEPKVLSVLQTTNPTLHVLAMNAHFPLMKVTEDTVMPHHHDHEEDDDHSHHGHSHGPGTIDPHFFLSPKFLPKEAVLIKDALVQIAPQHKAFFEQNWMKLDEKIDRLNKKLDSQLGRLRGRGIIVSHSALGYFCADFGLTQYALEDHGKPLLPQTLDHILAHVAHVNLICGFTFVDHNNQALLQVANTLKIPTYEINPMAIDLMGTLNQIGEDLESSL